MMCMKHMNQIMSAAQIIPLFNTTFDCMSRKCRSTIRTNISLEMNKNIILLHLVIWLNRMAYSADALDEQVWRNSSGILPQRNHERIQKQERLNKAPTLKWCVLDKYWMSVVFFCFRFSYFFLFSTFFSF